MMEIPDKIELTKICLIIHYMILPHLYGGQLISGSYHLIFTNKDNFNSDCATEYIKEKQVCKAGIEF